jgi:hypothetical protein
MILYDKGQINKIKFVYMIDNVDKVMEPNF